MKTLQERFCAEHQCSAEQYPEKVFWRCLHRHALPLVPLLGGFRSDHFVVDRGLIIDAGRAVDMSHVREEVRSYFMASNNRGWLRRKASLRISAKRLMLLASQHLPGADCIPPFDEAG